MSVGSVTLPAKERRRGALGLPPVTPQVSGTDVRDEPEIDPPCGSCDRTLDQKSRLQEKVSQMVRR